jgi:polyferredoxin
MIGYSAVLVIMVSVLTTLLFTRDPMRVAVLRAPGTTFQTDADGHISNLYNVKFSSRIFQDFTPEVRLLSPKNGTVKQIGSAPLLKGGDVAQSTILVSLPEEEITGLKVPIRIGVFKDGKLVEETETTFFGPVKK